MTIELPRGAPSPRLCHLHKDFPEQEYGYNLHAEKGKQQFIGTVDSESPASIAGLRSGDRIFAVNGTGIIGFTHKQVVQRIKENPLECELLVLGEEGCEWYKKHNIPVTLSLPNIIRLNENNQDESDISSNEPTKNSEKSSPIPTAHWYAPKEQDKPVFNPPPPPANFDFPMVKALKPRLCHLRKADPSDEFGFNLHAEKNTGHFVGAVDKGGIGEMAGLMMGQRIVGVNGQLIYPNTPHKEVVSLIKMNPLQTDLLVASEEVDHWYKENMMEYSFSDAEIYNVLKVSCSYNDEPNPMNAQSKVDDADKNGWQTETVHLVMNGHGEDLLNRDEELPKSDLEEFVKCTPIPESHSRITDDSRQDVILDYGNEDEKAIEIETKKEETTLAEPGALFKDQDIPTLQVESRVAEVSDVPNSTGKLTSVVVPVQNEKPATFDHATEKSAEKHKQNEYDMDIFQLSAEEARHRLTHRKKDPRRDVIMTLEEKYRLVSNM